MWWQWMTSHGISFSGNQHSWNDSAPVSSVDQLGKPVLLDHLSTMDSLSQLTEGPQNPGYGNNIWGICFALVKDIWRLLDHFLFRTRLIGGWWQYTRRSWSIFCFLQYEIHRILRSPCWSIEKLVHWPFHGGWFHNRLASICRHLKTIKVGCFQMLLKR